MGESRGEFSDLIRDLELSDADLIKALDARAVAIQKLRELREREPEGYFKLPGEHEVIERALELARSFPKENVVAVLREVLAASTQMIAPHEVAYLGPEGGFAHVAARAHFGSATVLRATASVLDVFDEVTKKRSAYGVVPLETSSDGAVTATLNGLVQSDLKICAEHTVAAHYHLVSKNGNGSDIKKVYGASQAIAACSNFLRTHFPRAILVDVPSFEIAAKLAKEEDLAAAVITDLRVHAQGLEVIRERVEDAAGTSARFAVIGNDFPARTGTDRTVLAMAAADKPGSLYRSLQPFSDRGINLTRLESRPAQEKSWRYLFFVEFDGHITDRPVMTAVEEIRGLTKLVKVLGSYPRPK